MPNFALMAQENPDNYLTIQKPSNKKEQWVPAGFENLNVTQTTEVDVYYGGFYLTSVLAQFNNSEITILNRSQLINSLSDLIDPINFEVLLSSSFDTHPELLCQSNYQIDCGILETNSVEVIFDNSTLRLWLFISPNLLVSENLNDFRFLPRSNAGLSFMNQSSLNFNGEDLNVETYNLQNTSMFAWQENRITLTGNLATDIGYEIDTLAFFREFNGRDYRLGLFRENANGFNFMSNEHFIGASFSSSLLTRNDLAQSLGTEIELFLATRSRVDIYREGRLISTQFYDVGNRLLDTSALPNGSYEIEIQIIDSAGNTQTEQRFYSKSSSIAPVDQPLYFVNIGRPEHQSNQETSAQENLFLRSGYSKRLMQNLGASAGFSIVDGTSMLETGLYRQGQNLETQVNLAYENTGTTGLDFRFRYRHELFNFTLNGRKIINGAYFNQLGQNSSLYNTRLEIPNKYGFLSLFYRENLSSNGERSSNKGLRFRTRSTSFGRGVLNTSFELSNNENRLLGMLSFSYQYRRNNRTSSFTPKAVYTENNDSYAPGVYGSFEERWSTGQQTGNEYQLGLRADYDQQQTLEARIETNTNLGSANITSRYNADRQNTELSGRLSTSFASSGSNEAFGGKRRTESGFLINIDGDENADTLFNVIVNGITLGQTRAGKTLLVPVSPYAVYNVEIQSVGDTLVTTDNRTYRETVYPGNIINLNWSTRVINIALAQLIDVNGNTIDDAVILNAVGTAMTDENGYVQAEIDHNTNTLEVIKGSSRCEATFVNPKTERMVVQLGKLKCL